MGNSLPPPPFIGKQPVPIGYGAEGVLPGYWATGPSTNSRHYVKYVPVGVVETHSVLIGYVFWLVGFTGAHRFYFGKPLTGLLWLCTLGLFGIGWLVDLFLVPSMAHRAARKYRPGVLDYNVAWLLFYFGGLFGLHRFYQGKWATGILYLISMGLFGIGWIIDLFCLNEQIHEGNWKRETSMSLGRY